MKYDVILAGVGGQGVLSVAACIAAGALKAGLQVRQSEVHGMAQRGGAGQAPLRLSEDLVMAILGALQVPVYALFLAAFAANKVEGLSILKALGVLDMAPLAVLLPGSVGRLGWPVPQYWAAAGFLSGLSGHPEGIPLSVQFPGRGSVLAYILSGLLYAVWTAALLRRYLRRLE